jgi:hypothetical protein
MLTKKQTKGTSSFYKQKRSKLESTLYAATSLKIKTFLLQIRGKMNEMLS